MENIDRDRRVEMSENILIRRETDHEYQPAELSNYSMKGMKINTPFELKNESKLIVNANDITKQINTNDNKAYVVWCKKRKDSSSSLYSVGIKFNRNIVNQVL